MCHTCNHFNGWTIPQDKDEIVCVSQASKESFGEETKNSIVINNPFVKLNPKKALLLISATRLDTNDKGQKRMIKLARQMNSRGIPFVWLYFSNVELSDAPKNMICMPPTLDVCDFIVRSDYLVQLSSTESFCYSIVESLSCGIPVICTDLPVLPELGVKDGVNAHVLPLEMDKDYPVDEIYENRLKGKFKYNYDNNSIIKLWRAVLGNTKPLGDYVPNIIPFTVDDVAKEFEEMTGIQLVAEKH